MIQVHKESNNINLLHKEKERMRHHRQVKLLNKVMEYVPVPPQQSKTKVKKLRLLVLYTHYLKMVHAQLTEKFGTTTKSTKTCIKDKVSKSMLKYHKSGKEHLFKQKQKHQRAHIVFLHPDKSVNQNDNIPEYAVNDAEINCINQEPIPADKSNYKVPDVAVFKENNVNFNPENAFASKNVDIQMNVASPIASDEYHIPSHSVFTNKCERICQSSIFSEDVLANEKENYPPVATNDHLLNGIKKVIEDIPAESTERFSRTVNNGNLIGSYYNTNFCNISQQYPDSYILKDLTFSNIANKSYDNNKAGSSAQSRQHLINSEEYPLQNVSDMFEYPIQNAPVNFIYESPSSKNFYLSNLAPVKPQSYNWSSPIGENLSENSYSSASDKLHIDIENLSDSNPSYTSLPDDPISHNANYYHDTPAQFYCDSIKLPIEEVLCDCKTIQQEQMQSSCDILPRFSSFRHNSYGNHLLENEVLFTPLPHPYSHVYSNNFSFNRNPAVVLPSESVHALPDRNIQCSFISDTNSLYSTSFDNFQTEFSLLHVKPELNPGDFPESSQTSAQPSFSEEETSYSLSQYFKNS